MVPMWYSILCGALIGFDRELKQKDAGIKTTVFMCVGACIFTYISLNIDAPDHSRIMAQIVSGIGFLGGGVIFKTRDEVVGLTSAAIIWVVAGIGMLNAMGKHFEGVMVTLTILVCTFIFNKFKNIFINDKE
jgi:putative Mg2+ transporter-C (MgtC) family protein